MVSIKTKVAVYGSLREGFWNHHLLQDSHKLGDFVSLPEYTMMSLGAFPAVFENGSTPITMEVYEVDPETFSRLDILEGYPKFYDRKEIDTPMGKAWMYYMPGGPEGVSSTEVLSGDWAGVKERSYG